jgi:hypothetical protein
VRRARPLRAAFGSRAEPLVVRAAGLNASALPRLTAPRFQVDRI